MDASSSFGTPVPQLLCLSLHENDKIRVMNLAVTSLATLRIVIQSSWQYGIQSEKMYGISYEFKLRGRPWSTSGEQAIRARQLLASIFGFLLQNGWALRVSSDLSNRNRDRDTFYFKQEAHPNPSARVCTLSFDMTDTIRVISGPPEVVQAVRASIQNFWYRGMQRECLHCGEPQFKMIGDPWTAQSSEAMQVRMFVGQLIEALDRVGWLVYASMDFSRGKKDSDSEDVETWILRSNSPPPEAPAVGIPVQKLVSYSWS